MYVHVCTCVHVHACVCVHVWVCMYICTQTYVCVCVCEHVCVHVCMHVCMCACVCVCHLAREVLGKHWTGECSKGFRYMCSAVLCRVYTSGMFYSFVKCTPLESKLICN